MNIKEAAEKWNISTKSIQRWIKEGTITATKVGKQMIIPDDTEKPDTKPYKKEARPLSQPPQHQPTPRQIETIRYMKREYEKGNPNMGPRYISIFHNPKYQEFVATHPEFTFPEGTCLKCGDMGTVFMYEPFGFKPCEVCKEKTTQREEVTVEE